MTIAVLVNPAGGSGRRRAAVKAALGSLEKAVPIQILSPATREEAQRACQAGIALLNDRRRGRGKEIYEGLNDDETSSLDNYDLEPVEAGAPPEKIAPLERRYDDMT